MSIPLIALLSIGFGFITCFFGWTLFRLLLMVWGFLAGAALGIAFTGGLDNNTAAALLAALVGGLIMMALSLLLYKVGVFLLGAFLGLGVGAAMISLFVDTPDLVVLLCAAGVGAVIGGILSVWLNKIFIIVVTAFGGASSIVLGGLLLFDPQRVVNVQGNLEPAGGFTAMEGLIVLVIAVVGFIFQYLRLVDSGEGR